MGGWGVWWVVAVFVVVVVGQEEVKEGMRQKVTVSAKNVHTHLLQTVGLS